VAQVKPFRPARYEGKQVGLLESVVAPPYDVISAEEREAYRARSPYNVVHLTLPDDEQEAARFWHEWLAEGVLVRDAEPSLWWLAQDYVGPDGVKRRRDGLVAALRAERYREGGVLPHERTHAGPKEGRLRLLRALRAHVEPIFVLYEGELELAPAGEPAIDVTLDGVRSRLWRVAEDVPPELADATLLIADGHHRYETAVAFAEQEGTEAAAWLLAVVVPTRQEGLTIFPTHRIAEHVNGLPVLAEEPPADGRQFAEVYTRGGRGYLVGEPGELDTELVARHVRDVQYTAREDEARAAVDAGRAEAAFILRPPSIAQVAAVAREGKTMPQKSTYFFPKLPSGALFLPLD
jgi:uncharacterized protein (DUF1015 family)